MENVVILVVLAVIAVPVGLLLAIVRHRSRLEELEHRNQDLQADVVVLRRRVEVLETRRSAEGFSPTLSPSSKSTVEAPEAWASPESPAAKSVGVPEQFDVDEAMAAPVMMMPPPLPPQEPRAIGIVRPKVEAMLKEPSAAAPAAKPTEPALPSLPEFNWEQFMGVKLFAWIGGLALFLGLAAGAAAEGSLSIASTFGRTAAIIRGSCGGSGGGIIIAGAAIASSASNCSETPTGSAAGDS